VSAGPKGHTTVVQPTTAERTVARRAAESRATVPHLELSVSRRHPGELATAPLINACARALADHPRANGGYRDGEFELYSRINVGVVMALSEAYVIPTVHDADTKSVAELALELDQMSAAAAADELKPPAFSGATFTLWNASDLGIAQASLPVVPPQAAALAAGTEALTLSCDHRILYGAAAAAFLGAVSRWLEEGAA
jgi:pyruvate dehydrogenase E2 component (dihydrolipoamide acetyltransferase)